MPQSLSMKNSLNVTTMQINSLQVVDAFEVNVP